MSGAAPFPFPLVDVEGDARGRGRQYGRLAAERIATSLRVYMAAWTAGDSGGAARTALLARAGAFEPVIGDRYPEFRRERARRPPHLSGTRSLHGRRGQPSLERPERECIDRLSDRGRITGWR
jgi:hypothetical protein